MSNLRPISPEKREAARSVLDAADASLDSIVARVRAQEIAEEALKGLPDRDRVHFALRQMLGVHDPEAAGALAFAASRVRELADILVREAYEREGA